MTTNMAKDHVRVGYLLQKMLVGALRADVHGAVLALGARAVEPVDACIVMYN